VGPDFTPGSPLTQPGGQLPCLAGLGVGRWGHGSALCRIDDKLHAWLIEQPVYFVGTAPLAAERHLDLSPKGMAGRSSACMAAGGPCWSAIPNSPACDPSSARPARSGSARSSSSLSTGSDSCGFAVPTMSYAADRDVLDRSHERCDDAHMQQYWATKNATSIDGLPAI
jgi:hypothetical protein